MPTVTEAILEANASCPPDEKTYETLEIYHPSFDVPVFIVANVADDMTFGLEDDGGDTTFVACPLKYGYPEQQEGQPPQCKVSIDNVNRELVPKIRAALGVRAYVKITYREYVDSDLTQPAYGPVEFVMSKVSMSASTLTGTIMVGNYQNKRFPRSDKNYTTNQFPSLLPQ